MSSHQKLSLCRQRWVMACAKLYEEFSVRKKVYFSAETAKCLGLSPSTACNVVKRDLETPVKSKCIKAKGRNRGWMCATFEPSGGFIWQTVSGKSHGSILQLVFKKENYIRFSVSKTKRSIQTDVSEAKVSVCDVECQHRHAVCLWSIKTMSLPGTLVTNQIKLTHNKSGISENGQIFLLIGAIKRKKDATQH